MHRHHIVPFAVLVCAGLGGGCRKSADPLWTKESSAAYRAAWEKRRAGDGKAADAMLAALAKKDGETRAGQRAAEYRRVDFSAMSSLANLLQSISRSVGPKLPAAGDDDAGDDAVPDEPALAPGEPAPGGP